MKKKLLATLLFIPLVVGCVAKKGDSKQQNVTLEAITLSGDYQTEFKQYETFSYSGLVVTARYTDATTKTVTNYDVSTPDMSLIGQQDITVSYSEQNITKTTKYSIDIVQNDPINVNLVSILLNTDDVQKTFEFGEAFNYNGLIVTAVYDDESTKIVDDYTVTTPDMSEAGVKQVVVTYKSVSESYNIEVLEAKGEPISEEEANAIIEELRTVYLSFDIDDYTSNSWARLVNTFIHAIENIRNATSVESANAIKDQAINNMNSILKKEDIVKGTLFNLDSSNGKYIFDRDNDNNLTISYDGYPGHWVHTGTNDNLAAVALNNNVFKVTFRNDISEDIEVCVQMTDGADYKADSGIVSVKGNETITITLNYDVDVTKLYFFLDSCHTHERSGKITILETSFSYEDRSSDVLYEPKTIAINQSIDKEDAGANTYYTLTESDHPQYIERVSVLLRVSYVSYDEDNNEVINDDGNRYYGTVVYVGSQKSSQMSESLSHAQDISETRTVDGVSKKVTIGSRAIFNYPLTSKISVGTQIHTQIAYAANKLTFTVLSYTFYYGTGAQTESEEVAVNEVIYQDGSGYVNGDKSQGTLTATIPFSSFTSRSRIVKMDVNFTVDNTNMSTGLCNTYGKSQIYINGYKFTYFDSGNNNVLNIGSKMDTRSNSDTSKTTTPLPATMTVYPSENIYLNESTTMTLVCWWASAKYIRVDSVVMYTDIAKAPEAVSNLEAHPVDKGVNLTWSSGKYATNYDVYMNDSLVTNVATTYATIDGLTNGETYQFAVVSKNSTGSSEKVYVNGTPDENGTYDSFIEGLNTELEEMIGQSGISKMLTASNYFTSIANNARLKAAINKMQNGQSTKIAYMGGSITVGENATLKDDDDHQKGYAYYSYEWLKRTYDVDNKSQFINASISGTGSEIGIVRAQEDVLDANPDIIFIEFAANNGSTDFYKQTYESLIRKCLNLESDPAVILLFSCTSYTLNGAWQYMAEIGEYYSLPMFSFDKAMREVSVPYNNKTDKTGDAIWNAFSNDGTHPNDEGHQLYAKCLAYFLRTLEQRSTDTANVYPTNASAVGNDKYDNLVFCNNTNSGSLITSMGSFASANTATPSTSLQSDVTAFQHGWKKTDTSSNDAMVIEVNAKNFILIYEAGNSAVAGDPTGNIVITYTNKNDSSDTGTLIWDVSKTVKQGTSGSTEITSQSESGWENPVGVLIFDKDVSDDYIISISMENSSGICTIMAFGYSN